MGSLGYHRGLYDALHALEGNQRTPVRIYAPVGGHKDLLVASYQFLQGTFTDVVSANLGQAR